MNPWSAWTSPTEFAGTWSAPGSTYCGDRPASGAYIGCGNDGAAMIVRIGSGGCQPSPGATVIIDSVRAGTVTAGSSLARIVWLSCAASSAGASAGSGAAACQAAASGASAARNSSACAESTVPATGSGGAATGSAVGGTVMVKAGCGGTLVMAARVNRPIRTTPIGSGLGLAASVVAAAVPVSARASIGTRPGGVAGGGTI